MQTQRGDSVATGAQGEDGEPTPAEEQQARTQTIQRARATTGSYSITVRIHSGTDPAVVGQLATAVSDAGGIVTALDVVESRHDRLVVDVTCSAANADHADEIVDALRAVPGVTVHKVSRPHLPAPPRRQDRGPARRSRCGPATTCRWPTPRASDGSAWRSPRTREDVSRLTVKGNSVAVVTDGSRRPRPGQHRAAAPRCR